MYSLGLGIGGMVVCGISTTAMATLSRLFSLLDQHLRSTGHWLGIQVGLSEINDHERGILLALLSISVILVVVISTFAFSKLKSNRILLEKNEIIDRNLRDKEVLISEIQHRVKNNLQIISSLLSIQARYLKDENAVKALQAGRDRVFCIALIHHNLYDGDDVRGVDATSYVQMLCQQLLRSRRNQWQEISIVTEVKDLVLDVEMLIPVGLVLNELITNAINYSFEDRNQGRIQVALYHRNGMVELKVSDNGRGISLAEIKERNMAGFAMIKAYIQKLGGSFQVIADQGTVIECRFQAKEYAA